MQTSGLAEPMTGGATVRAPEATLAASGLTHRFGELSVLDGVSLEANAHEVVAVVGPSGCGKSTLLQLVAGLLEPAAGTIDVEAGDAGAAGETAPASGPEARLARCAYMPQRDLLLPWLDAAANAALALRNRGEPRGAARARAGALLRRFGLEGFESTHPHELSGGMRQRVAFARTLLAEKPLLLLDEPFAALDAITRGELQEWLAGELEREGRTVLLVTHDVEEALYLADRVLVMSPRPGRFVAELESEAPRRRPRHEAIADPGFVAARERALEALREGSR